MATQGNLFAGVGSPIGSSIFDPVGAATQSIGGPAQRSAMAFMQGGPPKQFGLPPAVGGKQMAFDFAKSSKKAAGIGLRGVAKGLAFEAAVGLPYIAGATIAGGISGASQWGSQTGLQEDYVGGAVAGTAMGLASSTADVVGGAAGSLAGAAVGTMIMPGIGTIAGGIIGGIGGSIGGSKAGHALFGSAAQNLGLAARAVVRTSRAVDTVQFGGNFVDSKGAYTMRQRAVQDMSGSMLNARQFLGNEAIFLHER